MSVINLHTMTDDSTDRFSIRVSIPLTRYARIAIDKNVDHLNVPNPKASDILRFLAEVVEEIENEEQNAEQKIN